MNGLLKTLILGVTAASLFAAVALTWVRAGALREIVRFAAGLMITIAILTPLTKLQLTPWRDIFAKDTASVERQIEQAQIQSEAYMQQAAVSQIEAYIAGRLREHGIGCTVAVGLTALQDGESVSARVTLTGPAGVRQAAQAVVTGECGIAKENVTYVEREDP